MEIRFARREDVPVILRFIRELADYEGLLSEVVATEALLTQWLFERETAEVLMGEVEGEPMAFALFFHNFSTFLGRGGIYLEDLYVRPEHRGAGHGKALLRRLAQLALERGCGRLEWWCLDWNEPSLRFYRSMGAVPMEEWTVQRVDGEALGLLAAGTPRPVGGEI